MMDPSGGSNSSDWNINIVGPSNSNVGPSNRPTNDQSTSSGWTGSWIDHWFANQKEAGEAQRLPGREESVQSE